MQSNYTSVPIKNIFKKPYSYFSFKEAIFRGKQQYTKSIYTTNTIQTHHPCRMMGEIHKKPSTASTEALKLHPNNT
jgi:hypothetical protein